MSVHDAEPMDVYVDEHGHLWRVVGTFSEPTVIMERIEKHAQPGGSEDNSRKLGGVSGCMWMGWERIYRPAKKPAIVNRLQLPKDYDHSWNA